MRPRTDTGSGSDQRAKVIEGKLTPQALDRVLARVMDNRSAAYLLVSDGLAEKCFFFPVGAIRLTTTGYRATRSLREMVLDKADISAEERRILEERLDENDRHSFDEIAGGMGLGELVRECSTRLVRDELLDLVVWSGAQYEYRESNPPPKIFDRRLSALKLSFGVRNLLKEVRQAIGRWHETSGGRVIAGRTPVKRGRASEVTVTGASKRMVERILAELGGGPRTFDELILALRRRGVDAVESASAVMALAGARVLELPRRPPQQSAEERKREAAGEVDQLSAMLEVLIDGLVARQRLASAYEELGEREQAATQLKAAATELEHRGRSGEAVDAYRRVLKLSPNDFGVRGKVMALFQRLNRLDDAIAEGLELARQYRAVGLFNRARHVFRQLIRWRPREPDIRRELIDLLVAINQKDEAVRELEALAELYDELDDERAALACQQAIVRLEPDHPDASRRLRRVVRRSFAYMGPYLGLVAGFLLVLGATGFIQMRYRIVQAYEDTRQQVFDRVERGDFSGARFVVSSFERDVAFDLRRTRALKDEIDRAERHHREERAAETFGMARALELNGDVPAAREHYRRIVQAYADTDWEERAAGRLGEIARQIEEAEHLSSRLTRLTLDRSWQAAFETGRTLARRYPWSYEATRAEAPLVIETVPPGATVEVNGAELADLRTGPGCVIHRRLSEPFMLTLRLPGFEPHEQEVDLTADDLAFPLRVRLQKELEWKVTTLGPITASPWLLEDGIVVAGGDQRVYVLDADGTTRWVRSLGFFADAVGPPMAAGGAIVVADRRGYVSGLSSDAGDLLWRRSHDGPVQLVAPTRGGAVVVASADRLLAYEGRSGRVVWETAPFGAELAAPPSVSERYGIVLIATRDARLIVADVETGRVRGSVRTRSRAAAAPAFFGGGYAVAGEDGLLRAIAADGTRVMWQQPLPSPATAAIGYADGVLYVAAGSTLCAFKADSGEPVFAEQLPTVLHTRPLAREGRVYAGGGDGTLYALSSTTGTPLWTFRTGAPLLASVIARGDTLLVASSDFSVYALND